jgi:hypothetical protein
MSRGPRSLSAWVVLLAIPGWLSAATLTVDGSGRSGYTTIQAAVDRAASGDLIVINAGTYSGTGNRDIDLRGKSLTIQSTAPQDANVASATVVDCQATTAAPHRAFYLSGCTSAKIAGLTITHGLATAGGAVYCANSVLEVANCRILNSGTLPGDGRATLDGGCGGAVYTLNSSLKLTACTITGNTTSDGAKAQTGASGNGGDGAGIYASGTAVQIDGCTISDNHTGNGADSGTTSGRGGDGGGVNADSVTVTNSTLTGNTTGHGGSGTQGGRGGDGGAIACRRASIDHTLIEGNIAGSGGTSTGSGKVQAGQGGAGGGIFCSDSLRLTDSLVAGNGSGRAGLLGVLVSPASDGTGAGIWCSAGQIDHCTIVANSAFQSVSTAGQVLGAGMYCSNQVTLTNSILWDNAPDQLTGQDCNRVSYCDIQGGACGGRTGNLAVAPAFISPGQWTPSDGQNGWTDRNTEWTSGNYRLSSQSPCIDAGDPAYKADPNAVDLAGNQRVADGRVDIGAYEFQSLAPVYHFQSPTTNQHFYTISESEKNKLITKYVGVWSYKGVAYYAYARAVLPSLKPVYRFWSDKTGSHFWTIKESEKDKLVNDPAATWTYEGISFYGFPEGQQPLAAQPVYRFWSATIGGHFSTIDAAEKDQLLATMAATWTYEGTAWYAYQTPPTVNETPHVDSTAYSFTASAAPAIYRVSLKAVVDGADARLDNSTVLFTPELGQMEMNVDFNAMTVNLTSLFFESAFLQFSATATQSSGGTTASYPFTLSVYAFFNTAAAHGPYAIDPQKLSFPQTQGTAPVGAGEDFVLAGSANIDGVKCDVNLPAEATGLNLTGIAVLDRTNYPSTLGLTMSGPFQWQRQGHDDLLAQATVRDHRIQIYVTSWMVQTAGVWSGKHD